MITQPYRKGEYMNEQEKNQEEKQVSVQEEKQKNMQEEKQVIIQENIQEEKQEKRQENKMGVMPINKLLISMSLPMMISMLVQALYNIVDSIFVARVSENALTAVSLSFPLQTLMIAVGAGTGVGINALLSKSLGEKDFKYANRAAKNGIFLTMLSFFLFVLIGLTCVKPFFASQTTDPEIISAGVQYLTICCVCSFGLFFQMTLERLLQSTGKTLYTMITQGTGAIINIILDPIMIFGLFGFPAMGAAGAAIATVTGQVIAAGLALYFNLKVNDEIQISFKKFKPEINIIKKIYAVGIPSIIMQAIGSVMVYGINMILIGFTATATTVFGVYFKLQSFIFMPVFGLTNGLIPIIAYNYGAKQRERMIKTIKYAIFYAMGIMLIGFVIMELFTPQLLLLFDASETMLQIGVPALRIIGISFLYAGFCIVCSSVFQALGNGVYSMIVSITRQIAVLLPAAYLLSKIGGLSAVWWAFPIADIVAVFLSVIYLLKVYKKVIKRI